MSAPRRGGVQHRGRVTVRTGQPRPGRLDRLRAGASTAAVQAVEQMRTEQWQDRLQNLVAFSPEAAAAMASLGSQLGELEQPDRGQTADPTTCAHPQASAADGLSYTDPAKLWRCDSCGLLHRWHDGTMVPA